MFLFIFLGEQVLLSCVIAFPVDDDDKSLQLKIGFDLTPGTNGSPTLRIRDFKEISNLRKLNSGKKTPKRSVRAEYSSESENNNDEKDGGKEKTIPESDMSDDAETSASEDDRRLSTRGLNPEDFEPEDNPKIHGKYKDEEDSE
ncbi:hypothetical protein KGM_211023 [Danaus plexippus plexippus]|uniref:Uncharacterized protein n=1 Tax=Danaus plexippus plexippus TaxID=278856 RepID=A0A212F9B7_DANPL|nr:hypothetical protein KGM_211023 [Danaus plexippus plexippus]